MAAVDTLYGGSLKDFSDSMAEEIEIAYNAVLAEAGKNPLPDAGRQDRRMLFLAIARGVVNHLVKKEQAISVTLPASPAGQVLTAKVTGS